MWRSASKLFGRGLAVALVALFASAADQTPSAVPARFVVVLKNGRHVPVVRGAVIGDDYHVTGLTGGKSTYPKSMVKSVTPSRFQYQCL
jgi:hypothetical protein